MAVSELEKKPDTKINTRIVPKSTDRGMSSKKMFTSNYVGVYIFGDDDGKMQGVN
jgi:hypothetical protein